MKNCSFFTVLNLFFGCLLAGCSVKKTVQIERSPTVCEARMAQVPFPCGVAIRELEPAAGSDGKIWEYQTKLTAQALGDFYHTQTELEGWREIVSHVTTQGDLFFVYQRPKKILTIDGRQQGRQLLVRCFTGSVSKI